ncbi:MAG: recombination-associated protein RdgC [Desulfovibrionaceae bacterium]
MGFLNAACSFTRFRIVDPVSPALLNEIPQKLRQPEFVFRDIDETADEQSFGWVCFEDMLDPQWHTAPPEKGSYFVFSLRLDTRRVPAGVIKKHLTLALRAELARSKEQGKSYVSRERKKELKEQVLLRLRSRFLPVPAEFNVIWSTETNTLWFASTQGKVIELFSDHFTKTFNLDIEQLTPYSLALSLVDEDAATSLDTIEPTRFAAE